MGGHLNRAFWVVVVIVAALEGTVLYRQWPAPPLKVCASFELGDLLAAAARADGDLRAARTGLQATPENATMQEVLRLEAASGAAWNEVARYKKEAVERQKANVAAGREGSCR